jgi:hypothetical protein
MEFLQAWPFSKVGRIGFRSDWMKLLPGDGPSNRFDRFPGRLHRNNDTQRGLVILDETSYET